MVKKSPCMYKSIFAFRYRCSLKVKTVLETKYGTHRGVVMGNEAPKYTSSTVGVLTPNGHYKHAFSATTR